MFKTSCFKKERFRTVEQITAQTSNRFTGTLNTKAAKKKKKKVSFGQTAEEAKCNNSTAFPDLIHF